MSPRWHTCRNASLDNPEVTPHSLEESNIFAACMMSSPGDHEEILNAQDIWEEDALSHNSGLQLLFLGTGTGHPAEQR